MIIHFCMTFRSCGPKIVSYVFETYLEESLYDRHFYHLLTAKTENWKSFIFSIYSPEEIL